MLGAVRQKLQQAGMVLFTQACSFVATLLTKKSHGHCTCTRRSWISLRYSYTSLDPRLFSAYVYEKEPGVEATHTRTCTHTRTYMVRGRELPRPLCGIHPVPNKTHFRMVPVRYRPNAARLKFNHYVSVIAHLYIRAKVR